MKIAFTAILFVAVMLAPAGAADLEKATFGAGCFWGAQARFESVKGVEKTTVGYTGGTTKNPTYEKVCTGKTGHAEVVEVEFDPAIVSYADLVSLFWTVHNPTQRNRQGPDIGTNYRSVIFFHSPEQEKEAKASMKKAAANFPKPIATEIVAAKAFYPAEEYHQHFLKKKGLPLCR